MHKNTTYHENAHKMHYKQQQCYITLRYDTFYFSRFSFLRPQDTHTDSSNSPPANGPSYEPLELLASK